MRALKRAWGKVAKPRHVKVIYLVIYALSALIGVVTLVNPPQTIAGEVGPLLTTVWAGLFIVGGVVGTVTVLPGWWWAERLLGIAPILIGLAIYLSVVIVLHWQALETGGSRATQVGIILLAASPFILRFFFIKEYSYEPRAR
ncbi:hypothetical protein LVJ59_17450 [Microbacterium sp. KKR3/1]|uniref:hypothetical protein n=1 Tax=Microbacterium sp. KKR3/1 TaxID=2904241 RepID=UPI001E4EA770|nr:hypothetical protein [Microbacterium sp. KKR3/1]MCE0510837.1 hypothetical protein [Microbacterium sp. KKR3/1]